MFEQERFEINKTNVTNPYNYLIEEELSNGLTDYCTYPLSFISIFWNLVVFISSGLILKSDIHPRTTHIFLGNMALADLLHGLIFLFIYRFNPSIQKDVECAFLIGLAACYVIECSMSVCLIAIDRYIFIHHGLHYCRWITSKRARYMVIATWVLSFAFGFIPAFMFADYTSPEELCTYFGITPSYLMITESIAGITPNVITLILYSLIFVTALKVRSDISSFNRSKNFTFEGRIYTIPNDFSEFIEDKANPRNYENKVESNNNSIDSKVHQGEYEIPNRKFLETESRIKHDVYHKIHNYYAQGMLKGKSVMVVLFVTSTFTVAWGPVFICIMIYPVLCKDLDHEKPNICSQIEDILYFTAFNLGMLNALMNPIIYCWWHKGFRKALMKLCFKKAIREKRRNHFIEELRKQERFEKENHNNNLGQLCL